MGFGQTLTVVKAPLLVPLAALLCISIAACEKAELSLLGRRCDAGRCLDGFICNPALDRCVKPFVVDCARRPASCPSTIVTGDACPAEGMFVPCTDTFDDCSAGCRTCDDSRHWTDCSTPNCDLGHVWSCASCDDDCRLQVVAARGVGCKPIGGHYQCVYDDGCVAGHADADGLASNGCECEALAGIDERCDGTDNDCDGEIDEELGLGSVCGTGQCQGGTTECAPDGISVQCSTMPGGGANKSEAERCDGIDNDCDGVVDNGFSNSCTCPLNAVETCDTPVGIGTGQRRCLGSEGWGPCVSNWLFRVPVTFNNDTGESLFDTPVLIALSPATFDYANVAPGGADLRVVDGAWQNPLAVEIQQWNPMGESLLWVRLPELRAAADTRIYLAYGHASATSASSSANVWTNNFVGVWHLDENVAGTGGRNFKDATGHGHDGDDQVTQAAVGGYVGWCQQFANADTVAVPEAPALTPTSGLTLEMWALVRADGANSRATLQLDHPTSVADQVVELRLTTPPFDYSAAAADGADLRFFTTTNTPVPYWLERYVPGGESIVWVKLPEMGTTALLVDFGNNGRTSLSDANAVLTPGGLWQTVWNNPTLGDCTTPHPADLATMDTLFAGFAYGAREGATARADVNCVNTSQLCNPFRASGAQEHYATLLEGWLRIDVANTYWLAASSDDASDLLVGGNRWQAHTGATATAAHYGCHPMAGSFGFGAYANLSQGLHRFQFRMEEGTGNDGYIAGIGSNSATATVIPSTLFYYRPRVDPEAIGSITGVSHNSAGAWRTDNYALTVAGRTLTGRVGDAVVESTLTSGWHYVAMTFADGRVTLYVDGEPGPTTLTDTQLSPASTLFEIGVPEGDPRAQSGAIDEVRLSAGARSPAWLHTQYRSMIRAVSSVGAAEYIP